MSKMIDVNVVVGAGNARITMQKILIALGMTESDVTLTHDSEGRVVEVKVPLSEEALAAAQTALSAIQGVAVLTSDTGLERVVASYNGDSLPELSGWNVISMFKDVGTTIKSENGIFILDGTLGRVVSVYAKDKLVGHPPSVNVARVSIRHSVNETGRLDRRSNFSGFNLSVGKKEVQIAFLVRRENPDGTPSAGIGTPALRVVAFPESRELLRVSPFDLTVWHEYEAFTNGEKAWATVDGVETLSTNSFLTGLTANQNIFTWLCGMVRQAKLEIDWLELAIQVPRATTPVVSAQSTPEDVEF